jgi:hypothetical protein
VKSKKGEDNSVDNNVDCLNAKKREEWPHFVRIELVLVGKKNEVNALNSKI